MSKGSRPRGRAYTKFRPRGLSKEGIVDYMVEKGRTRAKPTGPKYRRLRGDCLICHYAPVEANVNTEDEDELPRLVTYRGRARGAHVLTWEVENEQEVPEGMEVRHKCDRSGCIQWSHLTIGTKEQNRKDMHDRGRSNYTGYKLNDQERMEVVRMYATRRYSQSEVAIMFGITAQAVSHLWRTYGGGRRLYVQRSRRTRRVPKFRARFRA